jgi:hypothetical protein
VRRRTLALGAGVAVGFVLGWPWSLGLLSLSLPCYILWVCLIEGPDHPDRAPGNWRRLMEEAEILRAQNAIRPGPTTARRRGRR